MSNDITHVIRKWVRGLRALSWCTGRICILMGVSWKSEMVLVTGVALGPVFFQIDAPRAHRVKCSAWVLKYYVHPAGGVYSPCDGHVGTIRKVMSTTTQNVISRTMCCAPPTGIFGLPCRLSHLSRPPGFAGPLCPSSTWPCVAPADQSIFCVHGGIPRIEPHQPEDRFQMLQDQALWKQHWGTPLLQEVGHANRIQQIFTDLLWSDPALEEEEVHLHRLCRRPLSPPPVA